MSAVLRELRARPAAPSHPANDFPCCLQRWHDLFKVKGTNLALSTFKHLCLAPRWGQKWVEYVPLEQIWPGGLALLFQVVKFGQIAV